MSLSSTLYHLHLVSDATGETISAVARACLAQFAGVSVETHLWNLVRTRRQMDMVSEGLRQWPGMVFYTFVDEDLRRALVESCARLNCPCVSLLDPALTALSAWLERPSAHDPGRQHALDSDYFDRIEAMHFALALDDGNRAEDLDTADVLVLGVSRTSKTPVCLYLANRGIRAANIPLVPGVAPPVDLDALAGRGKPLVVGLTKDPESLVEIRKNRLRFLHQSESTSYTDPEDVRQELLDARRLFARLGCPVIDVSQRSIEETAAEIITLMNRRALERELTAKAERGEA